MASWHVGRKASMGTIDKMSKSHRGKVSQMLGKHHTEETKLKIRQALVEKLRSKNISSRSNPRACNFINELNQINGWNLQHAENGGEVEIAGYFVDGYDSALGIVFEFDEPRHHLARNRARDVVRQNNIINHLKIAGKFGAFWRYDERHNNLYKIE